MGSKVVYTIGILALQGDYEAHKTAILNCAEVNTCELIFIKNANQLLDIDALVIPGGESSTMLRLLSDELKEAIFKFHKDKKVIYGTCAGAILLAKKVENPEQYSLGLIDIDIKRNAYGRQVDSFITKELNTISGHPLSHTLKQEAEAVFIRAPKITRTGKNVEILYSHGQDAVLVKENNILISTFHPELSRDKHPVYSILFNMIKIPIDDK